MAQANPKGKQKAEQGSRKTKTFNLTTYKLHALGDYPNTIRQYGTTDNYTTQTVSLLSMLFTCLRLSLGWIGTPESQVILCNNKQSQLRRRDCKTTTARTPVIQDERNSQEVYYEIKRSRLPGLHLARRTSPDVSVDKRPYWHLSMGCRSLWWSCIHGQSFLSRKISSDEKLTEFHSSAKRAPARTITYRLLRRRRGRIHTRTTPYHPIRQQPYLSSQGTTSQLYYLLYSTRPRHNKSPNAFGRHGPGSRRWKRKPPSILVRTCDRHFSRFCPVHRSHCKNGQASKNGGPMGAVVWPGLGSQVRLGCKVPLSSWVLQF